MADEDESLLANTETEAEVAEGGAEAETSAPAAWYIAEGVPGEGEKPPFLKDKYKTLTDQAKAYPDLEKKLGGFTGAPDEYELSMPDGVEGEWIEGDPLMENFQGWAKEKGLNQEAFTELLHMYVQNEAQNMGTNREAELAALGPDAIKRLTNIKDYARANLSEEDYQGIKDATTTAAGVKAVEAIIAKTRSLQIPADDADTTTGIPTAEEIRERVADPRYNSSPEFRAETNKMRERLYGSGPLKKVIG